MSENPEHTQMTERQQHLLKILVERYIGDGQPVGSRTLVKESGLDLSSATIRNVMADLEDLGLITSPHTSAGRVPTNLGYRMFVDSLLTVEKLSTGVIQKICTNIESEEDIEVLLGKTSSMLSEVTQLAGLVMIPRVETQSLRHVEFLPLSDNRVLAVLVINNKDVQNKVIHTQRAYSASELEQAANYLNKAFVGRDLSVVRSELLKDMSDAKEQVNQLMTTVIEMTEALNIGTQQQDYVIAGETNLMEQGQMSDLDQLRQLFEAFNHKQDILHLLDQALDGQGIQLFIGEESGYKAFDDCSIVTSTYEADGEVLGVLGIIGPTRMSYEKVIPVVDTTAKMLGSVLKSLH
ncbi:MAG: heat-inducible transcriptional repressor HrcA [Gammaproteobacteria bacterium]